MLLTSKRRSAAVAVLVAVCLAAIMSIVAIALDGGLLLDQRRRVQAAADAAALAAADDLYNNYQTGNGLDMGGTATASALSNAAANGYNNDRATSFVTPHIPPSSGNYTNQPGYAEVIIQFNQKRGFSGIFGSGDIPVTARAVARGQWVAFNYGIIVLDPTSQGALTGTGNGVALVKGGASIIVDSNNAAGGVLGGGAVVTDSGAEIDFSGIPGYSTSGGGAFNGTIKSGQTPTPDPLAYLPPPDESSLQSQSSQTLKITSETTVTLNPGIYTGGISASGKANIVLNPGIYYMDGGGFSFSGQGRLTGNGVMIYNAPANNSDGISLDGTLSDKVNLTPMTTGIYQGISIFQDRNSTAPISVTGSSTLNMTGTFYAASASVTIAGNGDLIGSQYISYDLNVNGGGALNINWDPNPTAKTRIIGLVE
jgi:hypothetical protein